MKPKKYFKCISDIDPNVAPWIPPGFAVKNQVEGQIMMLLIVSLFLFMIWMIPFIKFFLIFFVSGKNISSLMCINLFIIVNIIYFENQNLDVSWLKFSINIISCNKKIKTFVNLENCFFQIKYLLSLSNWERPKTILHTIRLKSKVYINSWSSFWVAHA